MDQLVAIWLSQLKATPVLIHEWDKHRHPEILKLPLGILLYFLLIFQKHLSVLWPVDVGQNANCYLSESVITAVVIEVT